jgi:hypothetical protein
LYLILPWNSQKEAQDKLLQYKEYILKYDWKSKSYEGACEKKDALDGILSMLKNFN